MYYSDVKVWVWGLTENESESGGWGGVWIWEGALGAGRSRGFEQSADRMGSRREKREQNRKGAGKKWEMVVQAYKLRAGLAQGM